MPFKEHLQKKDIMGATTLEEKLMMAQSLAGKSSLVKPRVNGIKRLFTHQVFRQLVQFAFAAFIAWVTIIHVSVGESAGGATASPEAYCPFGGLETLYKYITGNGSFVSHTHLSNLVIAIGVLATALLLRSAFCGWICPLGFIQDMLHSFSAWLQKRFLPVRKFFRTLAQRGQRVWAFLDRYLRFLKYGILVWAVTGAAIYGVMVFRDYDPWSALINIAEWTFTPGLVVLILTLVGSLFVERPWCRYACPLGAISGLLGKLSPVYIKREAATCTSCKICTKACPMGLQVHTATIITSVDCISCLECVGECPRQGAMEVKVGLPLTAK
jgi:polyferredoxin